MLFLALRITLLYLPSGQVKVTAADRGTLLF